MNAQSPHSIEAERALLGTLIANPESMHDVHERGLRREHFFRVDHAAIYVLLGDMLAAGDPIDAVTLPERVSALGVDRYGGHGYVIGLLDTGPPLGSLPYYVDLVCRLWQRRQLIARVETGLIALRDTADPDVDRVQDRIVADVSGVSLRPNGKWVRLDESVGTVLEAARVPPTDGDRVFLKTGFTDLDGIVGLFGGELIVIAGRPSHGKTSLAVDIAVNIANPRHDPTGAGTPVGIFSLEMGRDELTQRVIAGEARVSLRSIRRRVVDTGELAYMEHAGADLVRFPIYIDDTPGLTIGEIVSRAQRLHALTHGKLGLLVIDYLQLIEGGGTDYSREREVAGITARLKRLAKAMQIPIILLAQLNRGCEDRKDKRPALADLRESGAIEQDADTVLAVHRGEMYWPEDVFWMRRAEVLVLKQRNGRTGTVTLRYVGEQTRFEDMPATPPGPPPKK